MHNIVKAVTIFAQNTWVHIQDQVVTRKNTAPQITPMNAYLQGLSPTVLYPLFVIDRMFSAAAKLAAAFMKKLRRTQMTSALIAESDFRFVTSLP